MKQAQAWRGSSEPGREALSICDAAPVQPHLCFQQEGAAVAKFIRADLG